MQLLCRDTCWWQWGRTEVRKNLCFKWIPPFDIAILIWAIAAGGDLEESPLLFFDCYYSPGRRVCHGFTLAEVSLAVPFKVWLDLRQPAYSIGTNFVTANDPFVWVVVTLVTVGVDVSTMAAEMGLSDTAVVVVTG